MAKKFDRVIIDRLRAHIQANAPTNDRVKAGLLRVAMIVTAKAKLNVRKSKPSIIDTGHLSNSLRWEFRKNGDVNSIAIGSFGVIYAAMNEFGGPISEKQRRAMFAAMSKRRVKRAPRNPPVVTKNPNGEGLYWRPRPYLTPAFVSSKDQILAIINDLIGQKK